MNMCLNMEEQYTHELSALKSDLIELRERASVLKIELSDPPLWDRQTDPTGTSDEESSEEESSEEEEASGSEEDEAGQLPAEKK